LVGRCGFQADDGSRPQGRPSPAHACISSESGRASHRSSRSAPSGSPQFARWLRGAGQPSRAVCDSAHRRPLRVLDAGLRESARKLVVSGALLMSRPADTSANLRQIKMAPSTWCFFPIQRADREPRAQ
jgi:hypothetical protein